jgi:hypothetical protein
MISEYSYSGNSKKNGIMNDGIQLTTDNSDHFTERKK